MARFPLTAARKRLCSPRHDPLRLSDIQSERPTCCGSCRAYRVSVRPLGTPRMALGLEVSKAFNAMGRDRGQSNERLRWSGSGHRRSGRGRLRDSAGVLGGAHSRGRTNRILRTLDLQLFGLADYAAANPGEAGFILSGAAIAIGFGLGETFKWVSSRSASV